MLHDVSGCSCRHNRVTTASQRTTSDERSIYHCGGPFHNEDRRLFLAAHPDPGRQAAEKVPSSAGDAMRREIARAFSFRRKLRPVRTSPTIMSATSFISPGCRPIWSAGSWKVIRRRPRWREPRCSRANPMLCGDRDNRKDGRVERVRLCGLRVAVVPTR